MRRLPALAALAVLGACSGGPRSLGARFAAPGALAAFNGFTEKHAGIHRYVAVANTRGDEVRFIDPEDNRVLPGPGLVFPLSIPTEAPEPARLAAASLGDGAEGADLLVAVGAGSTRVEVVDTWDPHSRLAFSVDLSLEPDIGTAAAVLSLAAARLEDGAGTPLGIARVFAGISGGKLAVLDFERVPGEAGIRHRATAVKALGFAPLDIAVAPGGGRIFCASGDPLPGASGPVFGVAQVDVPLDPSVPTAVWNVLGLDALAPTRLVAAATLAERTTDSSGGTDDFHTNPPRLQVYAVLDNAGCGLHAPIGCGLATLLPDQGLAPDPMGELPYRAPIPLPGFALAIAVAEPPARLPDGTSPPGLILNPAVGLTATSAALAVASTQGRIYLVDLGRYSVANDTSFVNGARRTKAGDAVAVGVEGKPQVVLTPTTNPPDLAIQVTPGYTGTDSWSIRWQGILPSFGYQFAVIGRDAGGPWIAFQVDSGLEPAPGIRWHVLAPVAEPELGIHVGDLAEVLAANETACAGDPYQGSFRSAVTAILPPDPVNWPGGALRLADLGCLESVISSGSSKLLVAAIRASGLVLSGLGFGYAGRPEFDVPFEIRWKPEVGLGPEELLIARKARRHDYPPSNKCQGTGDSVCNPVDPLQPGPHLAFTVTRSGDPGVEMPVDTGLDFSTQSAFLPMSRTPPFGSAMPVGVLAFDQSIFDVNRGMYFYATYTDDQVSVIPAGQPANQVADIR